jgi:hypothetical protein
MNLGNIILSESSQSENITRFNKLVDSAIEIYFLTVLEAESPISSY